MEKIKNISSKLSAFKKKMSAVLDKLKDEYAYLVKPFITFIIIYTLAIYPIIRANYNYIDDIGRVFFGYSGWNDFSRFISCYLSTFIHSSRYLTDISPLPQLIAVVFISLSSVIIIHLFKKEKHVSFLNLITIIPLGLSPYFLECLSYKYDAPYMALSVLASVFPFLFYKKDSKYNIPFCVSVFIGVLVMCMTYQAASGILPLMALFLALKFWNNNELKDGIKLLVLAAISYLCGMAFFKLFILVPISSYASSGLLSIRELIPGFFNNLHTYYSNVLADFRHIELLLLGLLIIFFIISQVIDSKQKKILSLIVSCVTVGLALLITFGLYPALEKPLFSARGMYGFGAFIALVGFNATNLKHSYIPKLVGLGLCWCLFTFSFTYGNVLSEEKKFIDFRIQSIINGINEMDIMLNDTPKTIKLVGVSSHTPVMDNMPDSFKRKLNRLVPVTLSGNWTWGISTLGNYYKIPNATAAIYNEEIPDGLSLFKDTAYYKIETNNVDYILVTIK